MGGDESRAHFETQANVWEPRENRGRLRHCDGLQTSMATARERGKAEVRFETRSQDTGWLVLVWSAQAGCFSVKEKDEARLMN